jgi:hypothetical protein
MLSSKVCATLFILTGTTQINIDLGLGTGTKSGLSEPPGLRERSSGDPQVNTRT